MSPRVVLVGPPGSGKSTVGALIAARLGVAAVDTDAAVEAAAGATVAEVFAADGEAAFRVLERAAVIAALTGDGVVSLGGGAVLHPGTRADLASLPVAHLEVGWGSAAPRLGRGAARPLLAGDPQQRWTALVTARATLYREVATVTVVTDALDAERVAARVLAALDVAAGRD